jgi:hypothetical protein
LTQFGKVLLCSAGSRIKGSAAEEEAVGLRIRDATEADLPAIMDIYNQSIPAGWSTADTQPIAVTDSTSGGLATRRALRRRRGILIEIRRPFTGDPATLAVGTRASNPLINSRMIQGR